MGRRGLLAVRRSHADPELTSLPVEHVILLEPDDGAGELAKIVRNWIRLHGATITDVAAFHDDYHQLAAGVASALGLPYYVDPDSVARSKSKPDARLAAEAAGGRTVRYRTFSDSSEVADELDGTTEWVLP